MDELAATDTMYQAIAGQMQLPADVALQLLDAGFVVIPGPATGGIERLSEAYDHAVTTADAADVRITSSTRVTDFVNRGPEFDNIYIFPPLLAACCLIIGRPFKLSGTRAREWRYPLRARFALEAARPTRILERSD